MKNAPTFGRRLFDLRREAGISRANLAARVQISAVYLEKIERGYAPPPAAATIRAFVKSLGVDSDELFCLAGKLPPDLSRDLVCSPLMVQVLRVASTWDGEQLRAFLRVQGVSEEKLQLASTCSRSIPANDERRCTRETITATTKKAVFARDNHECVYCSARAILEVDHIHPHSLGGTNEFDNLITACHKCNLKKRNRVAPFPMVFGRFRCEVESES